MNMKQVKAKAKNIGINPGKMRKADLIRSIQTREGYTPCFLQQQSNACKQKECCWREDCLVH